VSPSYKTTIGTSLILNPFLLAFIKISVETLIPYSDGNISSRIDVQGTDGVFFRISNTLNAWTEPLPEIDPNWVTPPRSLPDAILTSLENFPKYLIWDLIPVFIFFIPLGVIMLFRETNWLKIGVIVSIISMSLPAAFAYSLPLQETRFFYFLYPLFCVVSVLALPKILNRFKKQNFVLVLLLIGIIISSSIFLQFNMWDTEHETEAYKVTGFIVENTKGVNQYHPQDRYIVTAQIPEQVDDLKKYFFQEREMKKTIIDTLPNNVKVISIDEFSTLDELLINSKKIGLSHLVIDNEDGRPNFFKDIFQNEEKYPFLIKKYDSSSQGLNYHVKIFEINYDLFPIYEKINN